MSNPSTTANVPQDSRTAANDFARSPYHARRASSRLSVEQPGKRWRRYVNLRGHGRRVLGLFLLAVVVVLWTAAQFVVSSVFADATYDKPYFFTWLTTSFFSLLLIPVFFHKSFMSRRRAYRRSSGLGAAVTTSSAGASTRINSAHEADGGREIDQLTVDSTLVSSSSPLLPDRPPSVRRRRTSILHSTEPLTSKETFALAFKFCWIWFFSNWLNMGCLMFATVASSTILTSTSGMWTLIIGALLRVEPFTWRKFVGVVASLVGVGLISFMDVSGESEKNRGDFPYKSPAELAIGDMMALGGAILYGVYVTGLTKSIGDESRINMPMFFGMVGFLNMCLLWPGVVLFHYTGLEPFLMPPTRQVWGVIFVTSAINLISDVCWAYAILLTSPLVTTVGLSLTIPLSLVGQMVLDSQYSSPLYWVGATIVVGSFIFINRQSEQEDVEVVIDEREE